MTPGDNDAPSTISPGLWGRIKRHPYLSAFVLAFLLLVLDLLVLPIPTLLSYRTESPAVTAFQQYYLDEANVSGRSVRLRKTWLPLRQIPEHVRRAVIVSEDASFWVHSGLDLFEMREAVEDAITEGKSLRGASTITQQLVKNLFLSPSRNPLRKWHEAILAVVAEMSLGKRRILELYLNEIEWAEGVYGIKAASRHYFGKDPSDLTVEEAAFLASTIPTPGGYDPANPSPYLQSRMNRIERLMGHHDDVVLGRADSADISVPDSARVDVGPDSLGGPGR